MTFTSRKLNRLKDFDYSLAGFYFITICSKDKENIFGECNYDKHVGNALASFHDRTNLSYNHIKLSNIGDIIKNQLNNISDQFKNVKIDEYIILPNHVHLILIINKKDEASASPTVPQIIRSLKSRCTYQYLEYIKENL